MPTIQQEQGRRSIKGLPARWGVRAYKELARARGDAIGGTMPPAYTQLAALLDEVLAAPLPIDATDAQLCVLAERSANECGSMAAMIHDPKALRARLAVMVTNRGITPPGVEDDRQFMLRCLDAAWWRRNLRRVHGRTFEHAAIRLGFVSVRAGAYASNETVQRHMGAKVRNAKVLRAVTLENENGYQATVAALAEKSVANKAIRRGELMTRMAGCEAIANERGDVGVFVTLTCPSKYHAVLAKSGTINPNYNGATPREAQAYLTDVWKCIRSKNHREGLAPYGFRIAEPHHDACPHWHLLLFVGAGQAEQLEANMRAYALAEDGAEPGAAKNRIKIVRIEASKGTAAGYIAKYVGKNIDGEHVGEHLDADGNVIAPDLVGDAVIAPSQRVEAWASTHGIRQFQPIGQPPVTVWRELRRVGADAIDGAPDYVRDAWEACQRVTETDPETGEVSVVHAADYAAYIRAQGGVNMGRLYRIGVADRVELKEGRYGLAPRPVYLGVFSKTAPDVVYSSTRYEWKRVAVTPANGRPWTGVNNCTGPDQEAAGHWEEFAPDPAPIAPHDDAEWYANFDFAYFDTDECKKNYIERL